MAYFKGTTLSSSERFVFSYSGISQPDLEKAIDDLMKSLNYKHLGGGVYERGNHTTRLLLGAFHKYFKFRVSIDASDPNTILVGVMKATSGMSGGVIGMNQVKTELANLNRLYQSI